MMTNKEKFLTACMIRAQIIWWHARSAVMPLDLIRDCAKDHDQFIELVEEREKILNDAWFMAHNLYTMGKEYSERNDDDNTNKAMLEVKTIGENICVKIEEFSNKLLELRGMK
jgi:hypothetical protein